MEVRAPKTAQDGRQHLLERCVCVCVCVCHSGCVCPTEKQYGRAREHFLHAEQPQEFGNMLVELSATFGYAGEADLFVTQAVLQ